MSSFKSSENIQKKEDGPDRFVSDNQSSSVTLNENIQTDSRRTAYMITLLYKRLYKMQTEHDTDLFSLAIVISLNMERYEIVIIFKRNNVGRVSQISKMNRQTKYKH